MKIIVTNKEYEALCDLAITIEKTANPSEKYKDIVKLICEQKNSDNGICKETYNIKNPETDEITHMVEINPNYMEEVLNIAISPAILNVICAVSACFNSIMFVLKEFKNNIKSVQDKYITKKNDKKEKSSKDDCK